MMYYQNGQLHANVLQGCLTIGSFGTGRALIWEVGLLLIPPALIVQAFLESLIHVMYPPWSLISYPTWALIKF
jgi:hypothetical protein